MFNFFTKNPIVKDCYHIDGDDYNHIVNVLRMKIGEQFLISSNNKSDLCVLEQINNGVVVAKVIQSDYQNTNLPIDITLFQGLPKSDKMELIIKMSVELGVNKIVPVETSRCIAKISDDKKGNKLLRLQAIAESASKQSKRNLIPQVCPALTLKNALSIMQEQDVLIVPYENKEGMSATTTTLSKITKGAKVGVVIGPEGGFSPQEIELLESIGANTISLGKRILRTETAAVVALSTLMIYAESNL